MQNCLFEEWRMKTGKPLICTPLYRSTECLFHHLMFPENEAWLCDLGRQAALSEGQQCQVWKLNKINDCQTSWRHTLARSDWQIFVRCREQRLVRSMNKTVFALSCLIFDRVSIEIRLSNFSQTFQPIRFFPYCNIQQSIIFSKKWNSFYLHYRYWLAAKCIC